MSAIDGLTPAQAIVWYFENRVTEAHRSSVERALSISPEQFEESISRARDIAIDQDLRLTPIYDEGFEGWWTSEPTVRIAAKAVHQAVKRNLGEAQRNARVYAGLKGVEKGTGFAEAALYGAKSAIEGELPELAVGPEFDYILKRIDEAVAAKLGGVQREAGSAAA